MAETIAGPFVAFVVERLGDVLIQKKNLLRGVSGQVEEMQRELNRMKCFLKDAAEKREEGDERVHNWVVEIREATYDAEAVIDTYIIKVAFRRKTGSILNVLMRKSEIVEWWRWDLELEASSRSLLTTSMFSLGSSNRGQLTVDIHNWLCCSSTSSYFFCRSIAEPAFIPQILSMDQPDEWSDVDNSVPWSVDVTHGRILESDRNRVERRQMTKSPEDETPHLKSRSLVGLEWSYAPSRSEKSKTARNERIEGDRDAVSRLWDRGRESIVQQGLE
ncbi:putative disease resistance protein [Camellia lanceoleosa]|uniref:Disease resistance protein n=1 Tax=Camellia lanceoleosa TaxID=1840588 RepID=A0ACC0IUE3_9ERIC|nr:putative disease resistance protein [Camellia lanceoleosa]